MNATGPLAARRSYGRAIGIGLMVLMIGAFVQPAGAGWSEQTADGTGPNGQGLAIVAQGAGRVHISYRKAATNRLMHATNAYGAWTTEAVGESVWQLARSSAIAVDGQGGLHISCSNGYMHDIRYDTNAAGAWESRDLDMALGAEASAIATGEDGAVHIAAVSNSVLRYATDASGTFQVTTPRDAGNAELAAGAAKAILVSSTGKVYIIYTTTTDLCLATNTSGTWLSQTIAEWSGGNGAVAASFDGNGFVHVAWLGEANILNHGTNASGAWVVDPVETLGSATGFSAHIEADTASDVKIRYYDSAAGFIKSASYNGAAWTVSQLRAVANVAHSAITVDSAGAIWLAYYDSQGDLQVVTNDAVGPHGADLAVTQSASPDSPSHVYTGATVTFTVTLTNKGPETATGIAVTDDIPTGSTFVSATPSAGTANHAAGTITWTLGSLAAGEDETLTVVVTMPGTAGSISNEVAVTSDAGAEPADPNDFYAGNSTSSKTLNVEQKPVVTYRLSFAVSDGAGGSAAADNGQTRQPAGTVVPIRATPDPHFRVKRWHGTLHDDWTTNNNEVAITDRDVAVEVTFERIPRYVTMVPAGPGTIAPKSGWYGEGTTITVTASPDPHYKVKKWTGTNYDASTSEVNSVTVLGNQTVTVEFHGLFNEPPVAVASTESGESVFESGDTVTLDGTDSYDPEGQPLTYLWETGGGPKVTLSGANTAKPTFTAPQVDYEETLAFDLTVTDDFGEPNTDRSMIIKIKPKDGPPEEHGIPNDGPCGSGLGTGGLLAYSSLCCVGLFSARWTRRYGRGEKAGKAAR